MEFDEYIRLRAYRILKPFYRYKQIDENDLLVFQIGKDEGVIGVYENTPERLDNNVLITTRGLHIKNNQQVNFIPYDEIKSVEILQPKEIANILNLRENLSVKKFGRDLCLKNTPSQPLFKTQEDAVRFGTMKNSEFSKNSEF